MPSITIITTIAIFNILFSSCGCEGVAYNLLAQNRKISMDFVLLLSVLSVRLRTYHVCGTRSVDDGLAEDVQCVSGTLGWDGDFVHDLWEKKWEEEVGEGIR